jgi:hypothetical protein
VGERSTLEVEGQIARAKAWEEGHSSRCVRSCQLVELPEREIRGRRQTGGGSGGTGQTLESWAPTEQHCAPYKKIFYGYFRIKSMHAYSGKEKREGGRKRKEERKEGRNFK